MKSARAKAAAAQLQDGKLLVTGGSEINSAELLTEQGWQSNIPSLPVTIFVHCMVTVNSTSVMVIGGFQNGLTSAKTYYFTFGKESWTEGPQLKHKRRDTICGRIKQDNESQKMSIIVAGGNDENLLSSVEILDEGSNEWRTGPELPFGIRYSQMVEDQNGAAVLIGGSSSAVEKLDTLYQLPHGGLDAVWTKMAQKLKTGRYWHSAFLVPDTSVDCS
jgi:N-acetylneuraminic acid mutarotase